MSQKKHAQQEKEVIEYWEKHDVFQKSITNRPEGELYNFYDGPPFATGLPHYGHIVASVMKDVVPRFWTMKGKRVERKWGWDCHGLPIEAIVEKEFDLKTKADIEKMGIANFNNACDAKIGTYVDEWKTVIRRLGRWVDMENDYKTKDLNYMESVWWVFKSLFDKGLIYEGYKSMHVSPALETVVSNFEVNLGGYQDITDLTVTAQFKLTSGAYEGAYMLAWTTTPWTLPGNVLLAVGGDIAYSLIEMDGSQFIAASELVKDVFEGKEYKEVKKVKAEDLLGSTYEPLFPHFKNHDNAFRVVAGDFVTTEDGTGIVHIAPGFGEDDMHLGRAEEVEPILHVEMSGRFVPELEKALVEEGYDVQGWAVKNKEDHMHVDVEMVKWLAHHGKLFAKKKITHSYPVCWRTDVPLINYAASSWFVKVTDIRDRLVATNKEINWVPDHMKEGRFGRWLEDARDWAVSRSRYWGTPLPLWKSDEGDVLCIGSVQELEELTGKKVTDLHKHIVDELVIEKEGKTYRRIPDVLDCWFESGSMPYAQGHYPFEGKEQFNGGFPAEFIAEGQDQTRGWFYTLHVLANALFDMPAYKNVVVNGIVLAEDGKKMSKRLKNYPDPMEVMERYGSDAVRHYLMASPVVRAENLRFSEKDVHEVEKKFISIMRNVQTFYGLYKDAEDGRAPALNHPLDRWIIARLNETLKEETDALETYDLQRAARSLQPFVTDLSTWYVRRSRDRLKVEGEDQKEALATLREVFQTFSRMIAPFMPFLAEVLYQEVNGNFDGGQQQLSVHLEDWPEPGEVDEAILDEMAEARALVSRMLDSREEAGVPIKQPLATCDLTVPAGAIGDELLAVVLDEVNVKTATVKKGEIAAKLDFTITPELKREGLLRDIVRRVNSLRKEAGKTIDDRIHLRVYSDHEDIRLMLEEHLEALKAATLADRAEFTEEVGEVSAELRAKEIDIRVSF